MVVNNNGTDMKSLYSYLLLGSLMICFLISICSCNSKVITSHVSKDISTYRRNRYEDIKRSFPKKLLNHFPFYEGIDFGVDPRFVSYTAVDRSLDYSELSPLFFVEVDKPNEYHYYDYKEKVSVKAITRITPDEIFYLTNETVLKERPELQETIKDQNRNYAFPFSVLNRYQDNTSPFERLGLTDTLSTSLRSNELDIFILNNGKNYILKNKPGKIECEMLPENKRHGYTSGIIFSDTDQLIAFWTIGW